MTENIKFQSPEKFADRMTEKIPVMVNIKLSEKQQSILRDFVLQESVALWHGFCSTQILKEKIADCVFDFNLEPLLNESVRVYIERYIKDSLRDHIEREFSLYIKRAFKEDNLMNDVKKAIRKLHDSFLKKIGVDHDK